MDAAQIDTAHDQRLSSQVLNLRPTLNIHSCFKQNLAIAETVPVPSIFCNMRFLFILETVIEFSSQFDRAPGHLSSRSCLDIQLEVVFLIAALTAMGFRYFTHRITGIESVGVAL